MTNEVNYLDQALEICLGRNVQLGYIVLLALSCSYKEALSENPSKLECIQRIAVHKVENPRSHYETISA